MLTKNVYLSTNFLPTVDDDSDGEDWSHFFYDDDDDNDDNDDDDDDDSSTKTMILEKELLRPHCMQWSFLRIP
jgi:hypothetical protein